MRAYTVSEADYWMAKQRKKNPELTREIEEKVRLKKLRQNAHSMNSTAVQPKNRDFSYEEDALPVKPRLSPIVQAAIETRKNLGLSQESFAKNLKISPRTLRDWEHGRRQPCAAALTLLTWVIDQPDYLLEVNSRI